MELDDDLDDGILNQLMDDFQEKSLKEVKCDEKEPDPQVTLKSPGPEHLGVLSKTFGHQNFRPLQWEIISSIIYGQRDVCAIMSTGYGKSLCFQFPSMFLDGMTLVISPLISLMEDQVLSLKVSNIPACLLGTAQKKQSQVIHDIFCKKYTIIYLTPEFCTGDYGKDILRRMSDELRVVLIAIDEAHCISSWGHDFRVHYRNLGILRTNFPQVPIIAVTATATPRVREDIVTSLNLRNPLTVCTGFDRPNIYFEINAKGANGVYKDLTKVMNYDGSVSKFSGPTIIYCITRKETELISDCLKTHGIKCLPYHAGLTLTARQAAHELFLKDEIEVIVATIAFGMGIDKPDIRNIVHYGCSKSIENYYQEVGRSGRDGLPAHCVTFYCDGDFHTLRRLMSHSSSEAQNLINLEKMEEYLTSPKCRRRFILEHFDDKVDHLNQPRKTCCDVCTKKLYDKRSDHEIYEGIDKDGCYDFTKDARAFLKAVKTFGASKLGLGTFVKFIRGSSSTPETKKKDPLFGSGKGQSEVWWKTIARVLIQEKYLIEKSEKLATGFSYAAISLTSKGHQMIVSNERLVIPPTSTFLKLLKTKPKAADSWISTSRAVDLPSTSKKPVIPETGSESQEEVRQRMALYRKLLDKRGAIASDLDCMPFIVASNTALMTLSKLRPTTLDELRRLNVDGFSEAKILKFGHKFLEVITGKSTKLAINSQLPIKDILALHPLPDISLPLSAEVSCNMLQSGSTIGEIAQKRDVTKGTIASHLTTGLKFGYPIKMAEFGVSVEARDCIIQGYRTFCKTGFTNIRLTPLKEQLPPEITYDEIKVVLAYLQVRCHLQSLNVSYQEFEDFQFREICPEEMKINETVIVRQSEDSDQSEILGGTQEVVECPAKKFKKAEEKTDFDDILASPPRAGPAAPTADTTTPTPPRSPVREDLQTRKNTALVKGAKSKNKALPPWLVVRKI